MEAPRLRLFLLRHGQVAANRELRLVGDRDEPLTDHGLWQAERLGAALQSLPGGLSRVVSSPRLRALHTAHEVATRAGIAVEVEPRLAEQSFGSWEGLTRQEVRARSAEDARWLAECDRDPALAPPGGESFAVVQERALRLVDELSTNGGVVALVSHVGPIKALLAAALDLPLAGTRRLFLDPGTISVVDWQPSPTVRLFNSHVHLGWPEARWLDADAAAGFALGSIAPRTVAVEPVPRTR